jgi:hypothetical protein
MNEYNSQIQFYRTREHEESRRQKQQSYDEFNARKEIFNSSFKSGKKNHID